MKRYFGGAIEKAIPLIFAVMISLFLTAPALADCGSPGDIIWSELDYDQPDTEDDEFIELYFPNGGTFTGCELRLINGNGSSEYMTLDIGAQGNIAAGKYFVWGNDNVNPDVSMGTGTHYIQNGAPDGFALVDTSTGTDEVEWFYSYEGAFVYLSTTSTDIGISETNSESPNQSCNNGPTAGLGDSYKSSPTPGSVGTNAITLSALSASATSPALLVGSVLLLGAVIVWRRKRA